jgi:transcriptional regulator with XRE-family HTH domain
MSRDFKKFRMATGLTQEEAAKKIGIHPTTLNKYESGARYPSGKVLAQMSRLYNVRMDSFILGAGNKSTTATEEETMKQKLNQMETELLELYRENRRLKDVVEEYEKKAGTRNKAVNGD